MKCKSIEEKEPLRRELKESKLSNSRDSSNEYVKIR